MVSIYINFHKMPNNIYKLGLTSQEFVTLAYLLFLSNNGIVHPSKKTIASNTNLSKRTVDRVIKTLVNKGFLEYNKGFKKDNENVSNQYRVRVEKIDAGCIIKSSKQVERETKDISDCNEMIRQSINETLTGDLSYV